MSSKKNKKKLCLVVSGLASGGVESFIKNYFNNMNLKSFDLFIITHNTPSKEIINTFENMGFKILVVTPKCKNIVKNILSIKNYIKKYKFDIVHSNMAKSNFIPLYFAKKYGVKLRIAHSHNFIFYKNNFKKILFKFIQYLNRKYANCFIGCSKEALEFGFGSKIFENKYNSKIIYNAIEAKKFDFNINMRNQIRKRLNVLENDILIGNIARFTNQKNHIFMIEMFEKIVKHNNNYKLVLIGDGELKNEIINIVYKKNISDNVIFLDPVNDIYKYYSAFDLFILPSIYEGLGITVIEAQANGLLSLVSENIPNEVIQSNYVVSLPISNKELWIEYILNLEKSYEKNNNIRNTKYDIKKSCFDLEKIYKEVLKYEKN